MFQIEEVQKAACSGYLVKSVQQIPKGHFCLETGFLYPDGNSIDIFLERPKEDTLNILPPVLSDFGATWSWLQNFEMRPNRSVSQKVYFDSILARYRCKLNGAALEYQLQDDLSDLHTGVMYLGQACMRVADLIYARRLKLQNTFNQDVEDIIVNITQEYKSDYPIPLRNNTVVTVDFMVDCGRSKSAVQTLSSGNSAYAHTRANEINAKWDDIRDLSDWSIRGGQIITIFDDALNVYEKRDLERLERKSILLPSSDTRAISDLLLAA